MDSTTKMAVKPLTCPLIFYVLLGIAGCVHGRPSITEIWVDENPNFNLYVSNQSFFVDPVDIHVELNGRLVISQQFRVGTQHNYVEFKIFLDEEPHKVRIWSNKGAAELNSEFTLNGKDTGIITYWYKPKVIEKCFKFETIEGPIVIL